jgi:Family of unknown function (DUF6069)
MSDFQAAGAFKGAVAGGVGAGVVNVGLYLAGGAMGAKYLMLAPGTTEAAPIPIAMPFIMSLLPALVGGGVFAALLKFIPARAWTIFLGLSALGFVAMLPGPFLQMSGDTPAIVVLEAMHVVVVAAVLAGIHKLGRG